MSKVIVEYVGPRRELHKVPKRSDYVYDEVLGRPKEVVCDWRIEDGRIFSQPIDKSFAGRLFMSKQFIPYDRDKVPKFITIPETEGNAMLKKKLSEANITLENVKRENIALRQNSGKADMIKESNTTLKEQEKETLTPKRGRPKK